MKRPYSPRLTQSRAVRPHLGYNVRLVKKRILLIFYDEMLLHTWQMLLEREEYAVFPALGFAEALELCQTRCVCDLVIMGHSMPQKDKTALLASLRLKCKAPLLSISKLGELPLPEADYSVDSSEGPPSFLEAVKKALKVSPRLIRKTGDV
jgi:PleD family two-component response regulator